jgi:hypothetical protein
LAYSLSLNARLRARFRRTPGKMRKTVGNGNKFPPVTFLSHHGAAAGVDLLRDR